MLGVRLHLAGDRAGGEVHSRRPLRRAAARAARRSWNGNAKLVLNYLILDAKDETRVGRAQTTQVAVERETGTLQLVSPACLTDRVRAALREAK